MKILAYRWKAYNYVDMIENFRLMGHEVHEISQSLDNYDVNDEFAENLEKQMLFERYDFVFTINYFGIISDVCQKLNTLYVCYSCDNPLISMYHESVFNSVNRLFLFDLTSVKEFQAMGVEHVYHLPLAVDTNRLSSAIEARGGYVQENYDDEIALIASLYEKNSYDRIKYELPEYLQGYLEGVMEAQRDLYGANIIDHCLTTEILEQLEERFELKKTDRSLSDLGLIFSVTTLGFKIAQLQRRSALIELSKSMDVTLYSGSYTADLIKVRTKGEVDYWNEMPYIFNHSKINLNLTIPNIKTGIPLRCFDVLGSRGFLLTNFQAEIPMFFEPGKDLVFFEDEKDMIDKCRYYLAHEDERKKIAAHGYETVKQLHNYGNRIDTILNNL